MSGMKTAVSSAKDALTLDLGGAVGNLLHGGAETAKHVAGVAIDGAKSLPPASRLPIKALEIVPLVGTVAKVTRTVAEVAATISPKAFEVDIL